MSKFISLSEKVKVINLRKETKIACLRLLRSIVRTNLPKTLCRKKKKFLLVLQTHLKLQKLLPQSVIKCLVKMEKSLNLRVEDMNGKRVPIDGN